MRTDDPTPEEVNAYIDSLTFTGETMSEDELPPSGTPVKVVRSVRLDFDVDTQLREFAEARGLKPSELARQFVEAGLQAMSSPDDQLVSRDSVVEALQQAIEVAMAHVPTVRATAA